MGKGVKMRERCVEMEIKVTDKEELEDRKVMEYVSPVF